MNNISIQNKTCCFTGSRFVSPENYSRIKEQLITITKELINDDVCYFGVGGAIGFDTIAAKTILELKQEYPHIKLILVLPCKEQSKYWNINDVLEYNRILQLADKKVYISEHYTKECMLARNRHLVNNSSFCIYYNNNSPGTTYTVNYAKSLKLKLFQII